MKDHTDIGHRQQLLLSQIMTVLLVKRKEINNKHKQMIACCDMTLVKPGYVFLY